MQFTKDYTNNDMQKMPYLQHANALVGHRLTQIICCQDMTEVVVVKRHLYNKFVSVHSQFRQANWEHTKNNILQQLGLEHASSKLKQHVISLLHVQEVCKGTVVL